MIYVIGFIGFVCGFALGQIILMGLLKNRSRDELLNNSNLRVYGLLNWFVAAASAYAFIQVYSLYFAS